MENFSEFQLDLSEVVCGGKFVETNKGCPDDLDYYDEDTGRTFWLTKQ